MQKIAMVAAITSLPFLFSACCKCAQPAEGDRNIRFKNYTLSEFDSPVLIYKNGTTVVDTVELYPIEYALGVYLAADEPLLYQYDLLIKTNDSASLFVTDIVVDTQKGCCKGPYVQTYFVDGVAGEGAGINIEK